jgi:hypothetical protein
MKRQSACSRSYEGQKNRTRWENPAIWRRLGGRRWWWKYAIESQEDYIHEIHVRNSDIGK